MKYNLQRVFTKQKKVQRPMSDSTVHQTFLGFRLLWVCSVLNKLPQTPSCGQKEVYNKFFRNGEGCRSRRAKPY